MILKRSVLMKVPIKEDKIIEINLKSLPKSHYDIINSPLFKTLLTSYLKESRYDETHLNEWVFLFNELLSHSVYDVSSKIRDLFKEPEALFLVVQDFYNYYRSYRRLGISDQGLAVETLITLGEAFNAQVISLYRFISEKLLGHSFMVYRQIPAGFQVMIQIKHLNPTPYPFLDASKIITTLLLRPPLQVTTAINTRKGFFNASDDDYITENGIDINVFTAFPVMVGTLKALIYLHDSYRHYLSAIANLFHPIPEDDLNTDKFDIIYFYGVDPIGLDHRYYHDETHDTYFGYVHRKPSNDYFGYIKKMILTMYNTVMIDRGYLPIHGAMVQIKLDKKVHHVCIIGDSGAGKSESLEALRLLESSDTTMRIIFDDMGVFMIENDDIYARGTEIGAFIRLDDLDAGYAYSQLDRAVFLNTDEKNARVILPVTDYRFIIKNHPIDMVLYANNYEEKENALRWFDSLEEAKEVFTLGKRKAKGTTAEVGLVESFFANPFGPHQTKEKTVKLIDTYFKTLFIKKVPVGELYTELGIDGHEQTGPLKAASAIIDALKHR